MTDEIPPAVPAAPLPPASPADSPGRLTTPASPTSPAVVVGAIAAAVSVVATFLPWVHVTSSIGGQSSAGSWNGFAGIAFGWVTLLLSLVAVAAIALLVVRPAPVARYAPLLRLVPPVTGAFVTVFAVFSIERVAGSDNATAAQAAIVLAQAGSAVEVRLGTGPGVWLALLAGLALAATALVPGGSVPAGDLTSIRSRQQQTEAPPPLPRPALLVAAAGATLGVVAAFLPWAHTALDVGGRSFGGSVNGFAPNLLGWQTALLSLIAAAVVAVLLVRPVARLWLALPAAGVLVALAAFVSAQRVDDAVTQLDATRGLVPGGLVPGFSISVGTGVGVWLALLAGLTLLVTAVLVPLLTAGRPAGPRTSPSTAG